MMNELPLDRPVPPDKWDKMKAERDLRHLPPIQTQSGMDNVAGQIAFDFALDGVWETPDARFKPRAGQEIFLKQGTGTMRYGNDVIQISPGHGEHSFWQMRGSELAPDHARVLLTFFTPVDFTVWLRAY